MKKTYISPRIHATMIKNSPILTGSDFSSVGVNDEVGTGAALSRKRGPYYDDYEEFFEE